MGVTVRDSGGIEIVDNHTPEFSAGPFWTIDNEPEVVLGGEVSWEGEVTDSSHLVWGVSGVAGLAGGRGAVLSRQNRRLYLFEPSGEFSKAIGREGRGRGNSAPPHTFSTFQETRSRSGTAPSGPSPTLIRRGLSFGRGGSTLAR